MSPSRRRLGATAIFLQIPLWIAVVLLAAAQLVAVPATAQVTVDLHALEALPQAAPAARPRSRPRPPTQPATHPHPGPQPETIARQQTPAPKPAAPARPAPSSPATPAPASAPPPTIAAGPPPPPPSSVAAGPSAPEAMATAAAPPPAPATSSASEMPGARVARSIAVEFAPGSSDLPPSAGTQIAQLAHEPLPATATFEVAAHAPAPDGDASSARRLSLARALAARSALVAAGVPGSRIYVRALGAPPPQEAGAANRATVAVTGLPAGSADAPQAAANRQGNQP